MKRTPAPRPVGVLRTPQDILEIAAAHAAESLDTLPPAEARDLTVAWAELLDEVSSVLAGAPVTGVDPVEGVRDRLLDTLIATVLHLPEAVESPVGGFQLLRCLDAIRSRAAPTTVPGTAADEDLRGRLGAPDAFRLLVEVAHDLRSPLTSILFLAETLRNGHSGPVNETQHSQLGLIYGAGFGLAAMTSDVLDLARQRRDLIGAAPESYLLSEVFENVVRLVQPIVEEKSLELRVSLPSLSQACGYPNALTRILLNLTTNALKFTDQGHVELGVIATPSESLEFYVQDTGRGISEEMQAELFMPFKRRSTRSDHGHFFSGSGVGLSIARRLVQAMGSELVFATSPVSGTRFSFVVAKAQPPKPLPRA